MYEEQLYMLVFKDLRDSFILDQKFGTLKDSSYIKQMYKFTFDNQDDGQAWELAELEIVCCVEAGRPFVQATYFL